MPRAKSNTELVWKYGRLSSIPFHSGIFHIPYRNFRFIPFSIPFHTMPWLADEINSTRRFPKSFRGLFKGSLANKQRNSNLIYCNSSILEVHVLFKFSEKDSNKAAIVPGASGRQLRCIDKSVANQFNGKKVN